MPNKNYLSGVRKERKVVNSARETGLIAARSAGSHSPVDVWIIDIPNKSIHLVQCKPKSMSHSARTKIEESMKECNGTFQVDFKVI